MWTKKETKKELEVKEETSEINGGKKVKRNEEKEGKN
jgi:hypothetical protein